MTPETSPRLRRYTELPFLIDYLRTKEITLLSPKTWDDKNDAYYVDVYAAAEPLRKVFALCLTEASETYHHWKVFSSGSSGICIVFKKDKIVEWANKIADLRAQTVDYRTINQCKKSRPKLEELPFVKRVAFKDEREFRLFAATKGEKSMGEMPPFLRLKLPFVTIDRIVLNPWLPESVADHVKATIKGIEDCKSLKVYRSTLIENESWKSFAKQERPV